MNWKLISRNVGYALLVSALFMLFSILVSVGNGNDSALAALIISFIITFISGAFPFIFVRKTPDLTLKEGYMIIVLSWLLSFVFGMLPYALWGGPFTLQNAWFESVSGFTTTGATILTNVEALPKSLLFWRSSTHFIGGLGVVVFLLLIIPNASPVKLRLTNMELSSLSKGGYAARTNKTVYIFAYVYLGIALVSALSFWIAGMTPFDAVCHAFSVCACGGFSTRNASIAAFDSFPIEVLSVLFMVLSSLHFGLIYLSVVTRSLKPMNSPVIRFYLSSLALFSVFTALSLRFSGVVPNMGIALWDAIFQTVSSASTTGFAIVDNSSWPMLANVFILCLSIMCGCAGSTTGGVKADRVLVTLKSIGRQIGRILHPSSVVEVRLGNKVLKDEDVAPHILYLTLYFTLVGLSFILSMAFGENPQISLSASVASLGNLGPAVGDIGTMGNYNSVCAGAKFLYSLDMFLGRVEIYPILAVVAMIFDRQGRKRM